MVKHIAFSPEAPPSFPPKRSDPAWFTSFCSLREYIVSLTYLIAGLKVYSCIHIVRLETRQQQHMKACGRGGWTLFMFNRIELAAAPRADEIAPTVTRAWMRLPQQ